MGYPLFINGEREYDLLCSNASVEILTSAIEHSIVPERCHILRVYPSTIATDAYMVIKQIADTVGNILILPFAPFFSTRASFDRSQLPYRFGRLLLDPLHLVSRVAILTIHVASVVLGLISPPLAVRCWKVVEQIAAFNLKLEADWWRTWVSINNTRSCTLRSINPENAEDCLAHYTALKALECLQNVRVTDDSTLYGLTTRRRLIYSSIAEILKNILCVPHQTASDKIKEILPKLASLPALTVENDLQFREALGKFNLESLLMETISNDCLLQGVVGMLEEIKKEQKTQLEETTSAVNQLNCPRPILLKYATAQQILNCYWRNRDNLFEDLKYQIQRELNFKNIEYIPD